MKLRLLNLILCVSAAMTTLAQTATVNTHWALDKSIKDLAPGSAAYNNATASTITCEGTEVSNMLETSVTFGSNLAFQGTITPKSTERWVLAAPQDADAGNGVTNTINVQGGGTLDIRTSTYADFANYPIEKDHVYTIYGVLSRYTDGWQLGMRTMSDINY